MTVVERLLEQPLVYRLWQAPFVEQKLAPLRSDGAIGTARRVLDVGCGPGTNTALFRHAEYVGIDHNAEYIATARARHGRRFAVADANSFALNEEEPFDFILVNSLLHHLDDSSVSRLLGHLGSLLSPEGRIHAIELVRPERPWLARAMARADRGKYARSLEHWRALLGGRLELERFEPFGVGVGLLTIWQMVYVKAARASEPASASSARPTAGG